METIEAAKEQCQLYFITEADKDRQEERMLRTALESYKAWLDINLTALFSESVRSLSFQT